jgi:hypothetical protein
MSKSEALDRFLSINRLLDAMEDGQIGVCTPDPNGHDWRQCDHTDASTLANVVYELLKEKRSELRLKLVQE